MKYCPVCQTRYDEEIIRFCTKDGAPLVEENPSFTAMPSESSIEPEDDGEETVIRRNLPARDSDLSKTNSERIVIPTNEIKLEPVRAKNRQSYQPPKSNTTATVLLTILGTFVVLAGLGGVWYLLRGGNSNNGSANKTNANFNAALNVANFNANFNADNSLSNLDINTNSNVNFNSNVNINANLKTPTPTRTPTPTPTPANSNVNANQNSNLNLGNTNVMSRPTATPTVSPTPRISPTPTAPPQNVNVGVMNSRAVSLTTPAYPQSARAVNAAGQVTVQITVDEQGNVTSARAISGHPLLRSSAEAAARQSRFNPVKIGDRAVSATGVLVYNFINQ
ncbi:MAG: TonB family protein [Pyrinomonadaceae bacterium]